MDAFPSFTSSVYFLIKAFLSHMLNGITMFAGHIRTLTKGGFFQLDYMLASEHVQGEACVVRGGCHLNSDHWPIDGSLRLERKELWGTTNHDEFSQRGWVPKTCQAKQNFMGCGQRSMLDGRGGQRQGFGVS